MNPIKLSHERFMIVRLTWFSECHEMQSQWHVNSQPPQQMLVHSHNHTILKLVLFSWTTIRLVKCTSNSPYENNVHIGEILLDNLNIFLFIPLFSTTSYLFLLT
jgi:hypothetical protein